MVNFDIIGALRTYAETNNWVFLSGARWYQNWELTQAELTPGTIVLAVDFDAKPTIKNSQVIAISYSGTILLGEKSNTGGQESNLDETFIQKYDTRLLALSTLLASMVGEFACDNELDINSISFKVALNQFDENLDGVIGTVQFTQGNG